MIIGAGQLADLAVALGTALMCAVGTRAVFAFLKRRQILDRPNERSSHTLPTPRGLGLGVIPAVVAGWILLRAVHPVVPDGVFVMCAVAAALGTLSWIDDVRNLPAWPRLVAQVIAVTIGVSCFGPPELIPASWMPVVASRVVCGVLWLGLINQINFTDGIDGHLGAMIACFGFGLFGVSLFAPELQGCGALGLVLGAAALGFLPLNWSPAKAFMGDVGSVPLGFLLGWLLLRTASLGFWAPVIILPLFYFVDTAITYGGRVARRERFWRPHRLYLYQRAARARTHGQIVLAVIGCNLALLPIALAGTLGRWWAFGLAFVPVALTYAYLERGAAPSRAG